MEFGCYSYSWSRIRNWKWILIFEHFMEHIDRAVVSKANIKQRIGRLVHRAFVQLFKILKNGKVILMWTFGIDRDYSRIWRLWIVWLSWPKANKREKRQKMNRNQFGLTVEILCIQFACSFVLVLVFFQSTSGHFSCDAVAFYVVSRVPWVYSTLLPILECNLYGHDAINQTYCGFCVA